MRHYTLLFLFTLLLASCGETKSDYTEFMGISMGEPSTTFIQKLEANGFLDQGRDPGTNQQCLLGSFAGKSPCIILVKENDWSKVEKVSVFFPVSDDSEVRDTYETLKGSLTEKYKGADIHTYDNDDLVSTDFKLKNGGSISLGIIDVVGEDGKRVSLTYEDSYENNNSHRRLRDEL